MRSFVAPKSGRSTALVRRAIWLLAGAVFAMCANGPVAAQAPGAIPDLSASSSQAWTPLARDGRIARYGTGWFDPPAGLRGPIKQHPDYPRGNGTGRPTPALGNTRTRSSTRGRLKDAPVRRGLLSGKIGIPFLRDGAAGREAPGQLLGPRSRAPIIQTPRSLWSGARPVGAAYLPTDRRSQEK
jgi:hypothetical protein